MKARPPSAVKGTPRRAMSRKGSSLDMMGLSASRYSIGGGGSLKLGAGSGLDSGGWGFVNAVNGLAADESRRGDARLRVNSGAEKARSPKPRTTFVVEWGGKPGVKK